MGECSDEAYVVGTQELGEADLIVTLFARHHGRVRAVARSARRSRRRFGGALEPLTRVSARWWSRAGSELQRLEALEPLRSHASLQREPALQAACAVLAEVCRAVAREEPPEPGEFRLMGAVLDALEGGLDPWVAVRYFEFWTLRLHGVLPDPGVCHECGRSLGGRSGRWVARASAGVLCGRCAPGHPGSRRLVDRDLALLAEAATRRPEDLGGHRDAARPGRAAERLLRGALEAFVEREFRTYRHLDPWAAAGRFREYAK